jgi:hypothetical protein
MSDLISRQAAIDALKGLSTWWADEGGYYGEAQPPMVALLDPEDAVSAIENLPSAQPQLPEWAKKVEEYRQSAPATHSQSACMGVVSGMEGDRNED